MTITNDNEKNENGKGKRNRRTRNEMIAAYEAKLARLKAQAEGTFDESDDDTYTVKRLRRAIRRRETAIGNAGTLLNGKAATEKSPAVPSILSKIENAEKRLADLRLAQKRAHEITAQVPFDVEKLTALLERAEKGEAVEFPTDLYILPGENDKTEAETEAAFGTGGDRGHDD